MTDQDRTELGAIRAEVFALRRDVDTLKTDSLLKELETMTPEQIQADLESATPVPLTTGEIESIVAYATAPATEPQAWEPTEEQTMRYMRAIPSRRTTLGEDLQSAHRAVTNQRDYYKSHFDDLCRLVCKLCEMLGDDRHKNPCDVWRLAELIGKQGRESAAFQERAEKAEADRAALLETLRITVDSIEQLSDSPRSLADNLAIGVVEMRATIAKVEGRQ